MSQRPAAAFVLPILFITLSSCLPSGSRQAVERPAPAAETAWFVLDNGRFVEVTGQRLPAAAAEAFVPWTTAERIGGFARLAGAAYAAVNGYGVARIGAENDRFSYFYDRSLFAGRTFQAVLGEADALLCHVYRNTLLAADAGSKGAEPPNLVRMKPGRDGYEADFLRPPFQAARPDWQAVSIARTADSRAWIEWKKVSSDRVEFAYTTYDLATGSEEPVSREAFRAANSGVSLEGFVPRAGRALDLLVARIASSAQPGDYLCITAGGGAAARHYVRVPPGGGGTTRQVAAYADDRRAVALEPDGTLLWIVEGASEVVVSRLPPLPPGYVYCDLLVTGHTLIAAWEQVDFFRVGRAGLLLKTDAF